MKSISNIISIIAILMLCVSAQAGVVNNRIVDLKPTGKGSGEAAEHLTEASAATIAPNEPFLQDDSDSNSDSTPTENDSGEAAEHPTEASSAREDSDEPFLLDDSEIDGKPDTNVAKGPALLDFAPIGFAPIGYGISYHGGPMMTGTTHIYYIWYGNWKKNTAPTILNNLAQQIGGSPRYNINTTYSDASNVNITNSVTLAGSTSVAYPYGKVLSDLQIQSVVSTAISKGQLPIDANGVYFVLTSKDVTASSGFGTQYCGWHSYVTIAGTDIKYSFVGDATSKAPVACWAQSVSPNGNAGADGMASVIVHELEEATTDPKFTAWYDSLGYENSDKCSWTFGTTTVLPNKAKYNVTLGTKNYLIQQNWVNTAPAGFCAKNF